MWALRRSFVIVALLMLAFLPNCRCRTDGESKANLSPNSDTFTLLLTTNLQGYVEPCGCTPDPLGGIGRLSAVVDEAKRAFDNRILLLDAGNLLFDSPKARAD